MDEHRATLRRRIRERLAEMNHNQRWLAEQLGYSESQMSRLLDGSRKLSLEDLAHIGMVLHRPKAWLMGEAGADEQGELVTAV